MASPDRMLRLPKVDLHCHFEDTLRPTTLMELAAANGVARPTIDVTELYRYSSLGAFLQVSWLGRPVLRFRGECEAETHVTYRLIADIDRGYGPGAAVDLVSGSADLRRSGASGSERVIVADMDRVPDVECAEYPAVAAAFEWGPRTELGTEGFRS